MKSNKQKIQEIFKRVNKNFKYISDQKQHGVIEDWRMPEDVDHVRGDCDDFALACRMLLREAGIPTRLIICKTGDGEGHLVCAAGENLNYMLDNTQTSVVTKKQLTRKGYKWFYASDTEPTGDWFMIKG